MSKKLKKRISEWKKRRTYVQTRTRRPVTKNVVLLQSYNGRSITGHVFYLLRELYSSTSLRLYVASRDVDHAEAFLKKYCLQANVVELYSEEYDRLLATAGYLVNNTTFPHYFIKRPEQTYLNTWHGTPLKTLGKAMPTGLADLPNVQGNFLKADILFFPNEYTRACMTRDYMTSGVHGGRMVTMGSPRNTPFFDDSRRSELRNELSLEGKRVILYMPTWRGGNSRDLKMSGYAHAVNEQLRELGRALSEDSVLLVKFHSLVAHALVIDELENVRSAPQDFETYDLAHVADILITDYSIIMFDFAVSRKEILLFPYDFEQYTAERGFYFDYSELPFPQFRTTASLGEYLAKDSAFGIDAAYESFFDKFCREDSPTASADLAKELLAEEPTHSSPKVDVLFVPQLSSKRMQAAVKSKLAEGMNRPNVVIAFPQKKIRKTEGFIHSLDEEPEVHVTWLPMAGNLQLTEIQVATVLAHWAAGIFSTSLRDAYKDEVRRLFGGLNLQRAEVLGKNRHLHLLAKVINAGS